MPSYAVPLLKKTARWLPLVLIFTMLLSGCEKKQETEEIRPVRALTVQESIHKEPQVVPGQVTAHKYINASFKISGKLAARTVSVGSSIKAGQLLARLNEEIESNTLTAAKAEIAGARAALTQATSVEKRAAILYQTKAVSQNEFEEANRQFKAAQAMVAAAEAKARNALEQLDYTSLYAPADGIVANTFAEPGEVVGAGHPILRIAEARTVDAVFDMPADFLRKGLTCGQSIRMCLEERQDLCVQATIYEIAPQADPITRTYLTKASIVNPPQQMLLGDTVFGSISFSAEQAIEIPPTALTTADRSAAVWVVNQQDNTVSLRPIEIGKYINDGVIVKHGLSSGEIIVTAGVQALHPGQKITIQADSHEKH